MVLFDRNFKLLLKCVHLTTVFQIESVLKNQGREL